MARKKVTRRLATILVADIVGYSRLMEVDEEGTITRQKLCRETVIDPTIAEHNGRIFKTTGDGLMVEFQSSVDAALCAVEFQRGVTAQQGAVPENRRITYRIGINLGDIVIEGDDVLGDGVNVAARLEALAEPGGICLSDVVFKSIRGKLDVGFADLGPQKVKNISEPVLAYKVLLDPEAAGTVIAAKPKLSRHWPTAALTVALVLVLAIGVWWRPWAPDVEPARLAAMAHPLPKNPSVAVLAFDNLSGDSKQDFLSDAMAETIITELSRFRELFVIARNSSFKYKGKSMDTRKIAEDLGVRYVLEGSLQRNKDKLRVTAQLIDALEGSHVWAEKYDRDVKDIFKIQDEITRKVVASVARAVHVTELDRIQRKHPASLAAYEYYLKGEKVWDKATSEANAQALQLFNKALALDPNLARGYVGRAKVYLDNYRWGHGDLPREEALKRAISAARKAVELDPLDWDTHGILAYIRMRSGDLEKADAGFQKAMEVNPNAEKLLVAIAEMRIYQGRYEEAIDLMKKAMRLNPHHASWYHGVLADAYGLDRQYEKALASLDRMTGKKPHWALRTQIKVYVSLDRLDDARATMREYLATNPKIKTLSEYRRYLRTLPWKPSEAFIDYSINRMRKAGMPE